MAMKYTTIDAEEVRLGVMRQKALDAETLALGAEIDAATAEALAPDDKAVRDQLEATKANATERRARARRRSRRAGMKPKEMATFREDFLHRQLQGYESEHAALSAALEDVEDDEDEDGARQRLKVVEAAHAAVLAMRAPEKPAPEAKPKPTAAAKKKGRK